MASNVRVKVNGDVVARILRAPATAAMLEDIGRRIAVAAGPGHKVESEIGPHRARVDVFTETFEAMAREAKYRSLTHAIDAGRV